MKNYMQEMGIFQKKESSLKWLLDSHKYLYLDLFRGTNKRVRKAALYELPVEMQEQLTKFVLCQKKLIMQA